MPIYGRSRVQNSTSVVRTLPVLPYPLYKGSITWGDQFDQAITGSINYQGVAEQDIDGIIAAYEPSRKRTITLFGIDFIVSQLSYERSAYPYGDDAAIQTFSVSISLEGAIKNIASDQQALAEKIGYVSYVDGLAKPLNTSNRGWTFSEFEVRKDAGVFGDGSNAISLDQDGHNQDPITFGTENPSATTSGKRTIFTPKIPVIYELTEASKNFDEPPENTKVLRDTTSNFDETGPKKVKRVSVQMDGKTQSEVITTKGFAYLQENIATADDELYTSDPETIKSFWTEIEERNTSYVYEKLGAVRLNVTISQPPRQFVPTPPTDPLTVSGNGISYTGYSTGAMKFIVHPDYVDYGSIGFDGGSVTLKTRAEFLTEQVTTGWKLGRFVKETDDRNTLDPEDTYYPLFKFKKYPFVERTVYQLTSARGVFKETVDPPFRVEYPDYSTLEPRLKALFNRSDTTADGKVAILYPDPNYVEPLYIIAEYTATNSFAWVNDPDSEPDDFDPEDPTSYMIDGRPKPPKRFTTGEESYNEKFRTIITASQLQTQDVASSNTDETPFYSERETSFSSQDPGFDASIESVVFRDVSGKPPSPDYRIQEFVQKELDNGTLGSNAAAKLQWLVSTTDNADEFTKGASSVSFPSATNITEAVNMLDLQLRKAKMQSNQSQLTATWFYPEMRAGQPIAVGADRFASRGVWRVTSVQFQLDYTGVYQPDGTLLVTTPGTQITRGLDARRPVQLSQGYDPSSSAGTGGDPTIDIEVSYRPSDIGAILDGVQNRRNF